MEALRRFLSDVQARGLLEQLKQRAGLRGAVTAQSSQASR
jgi:hypothetical protein